MAFLVKKVNFFMLSLFCFCGGQEKNIAPRDPITTH